MNRFDIYDCRTDQYIGRWYGDEWDHATILDAQAYYRFDADQVYVKAVPVELTFAQTP